MTLPLKKRAPVPHYVSPKQLVLTQLAANWTKKIVVQ